MIPLSRRFYHLLAQEIKRGQLFLMAVAGVELNIVADGIRRPKSVNAAGNQQIFPNDLIKQLLRVVKQFTRLFTYGGVFKDCRVTPAQLPGVKKWRPVDEVD